MKVVIIGAGVAGLAIGWRLALAGSAVTILERAQPGSGATWASAGMIAVTAEMEGGHPAEIEFSISANMLWPDFAVELEAASGRPTGYIRNGALILAEDKAALDRLATRTNGPGPELVDAARARTLAPMLDNPLGGLWAPHEAQVDNRALAAALAVAFRRAGGKLVLQESVLRIERQDGRAVFAHTAHGRYAADAFVLAAGAWSGLIEAELAPITPIKGQMIALIHPDRLPPPEPVIWGNGIYAVPRGPYLLIGATVEDIGFDSVTTAAARESLRARAQALMPALKDWTLADHWAGLRPRSADGLPLLGPTSVEGLWLAGGQYRNGILFAPAIADTMAAQILGKAAPIPAFDPRRFTP